MTPKSGPYADHPSSYIEEQEGVAKNTQGDPAVRQAGTIGERNRNSINQERQQQANARLPSPEGSSSTSVGLRGSPSASTTTTTIISESEGPVGMAVASATVPVCLHLTQEDLETTKLDPKEVDKNLKESSDENLMEHSQKQFCSPDPLSPGSSSLLYPLIKMAAEASGAADSPPLPPPTAVFPLPKQQNLPKRPSSLPLRNKTAKKESSSSSSSLRFKFGRSGKSNLRQVEGTKVNAGSAASLNGVAAEAPSTNNTAALRDAHLNGAANGHARSVLSSMAAAGSDAHLGLGVITASPDEHEPLLSREPPDPRDALRAGQPNTNNNNSNTGLGHGDNESSGESDGAAGAGEEEESSSAGGGGGGAGEAAAAAPAGVSPSLASGIGDAPPAVPSVVMRGEALLRQPRSRRPERPNSLDLSFTTQDLASLGKWTLN